MDTDVKSKSWSIVRVREIQPDIVKDTDLNSKAKSPLFNCADTLLGCDIVQTTLCAIL